MHALDARALDLFFFRPESRRTEKEQNWSRSRVIRRCDERTELVVFHLEEHLTDG